MLVLLPLELQPPYPSKGVPVANVVLIMLNVISYLFMVMFGWYWVVGPGTGPLSVLLYGFSHAGLWHLVFNMWALWVFGNPVNRRLGNGWYLVAYLSTIVVLGLFARLCYFGPVLGASGGIFAVMIMAAMLMPSAALTIAYAALFPLSILIGLIRKPSHGIYWFLTGGQFQLRSVLWLLLLVPALEIMSLIFATWTERGSIWHLGHLLGMVCGVAVVLMLPARVTMPGRIAASSL